MSVSLTRRALFKGRFSKPLPQPLRPPWSETESTFIDLCSRCDACIKACDSAILVRGDAGYPSVDFAHGECTFCQACAEACDTGAITKPHAQSTPWSAKAKMNAACLSAKGVTCRVCGDVCDARAIRFQLAVGGVADPIVDLSACTGCGACVAPCPAQAITIIANAEERAP